MPNDLPLMPPKNTKKYIDKSMISLPRDFIHLAHVPPQSAEEIEILKNPDNEVYERNYYTRPISRQSGTKTPQSEHYSIDFNIPVSSEPSGNTVIRGYENQPTSHEYQNIGKRPSTKSYKAPAPPPKDIKPKLLTDQSLSPDPIVVFRQQSSTSIPSEPDIPPQIATPNRINPPKPNSMIIDRPGDLGVYQFGLDDAIPIQQMTSPLTNVSPLFRPMPPKQPMVETPILTSGNEDNDYMRTIRSTSAQGKDILDDLDDWLNDIELEDKIQLSGISTDESGYPTLVLERDRTFMKRLIEKYGINAPPETIRIGKKKQAPKPPIHDQTNIPFSSNRPVSMPPNRPPPPYDTPSFTAPKYDPATVLLNGRALTKKNALDLRSTVDSDEGQMPPALARYLSEKRIKSATMPMSIGRTTTSSGLTDYSTTSSRVSTAQSDMLSNVGEEEEEEDEKEEKKEKEKEKEEKEDNNNDIVVLKKEEEIADVPTPKPRTKISTSEPQTPPVVREVVEEPEGIEVSEMVVVIGEELVVTPLGPPKDDHNRFPTNNNIEPIKLKPVKIEEKKEVYEDTKDKEEEEKFEFKELLNNLERKTSGIVIEEKQEKEVLKVEEEGEEGEEEDEEDDWLITRF